MSFVNSASLQARSIQALIMRRFRTAYVGSRAGYAWAIIEPICWVFVLKFALARHGGQPPLGTSFEVFFTVGVTMARGWRTAAQVVMRPLSRPLKLTLPAIHQLDTAYASVILELATIGVSMIVLLCLFALFGMDAAPDDLLDCLAAFAAMGGFAVAFGVMFAVLLKVAPALSHFQGIIMLIMFMTSGFAMLIDRVPEGLRKVMAWNPLLHCIEWFREGFYPNYECYTLDKEYLFTVTVAFLLFGLAGERALRRHTPRPIDH